MSFSRTLFLAAALAAMTVGSARADELTVSGVNVIDSATVSVPAQTLKGTPATAGDSVEVFWGRWRPYWRGYYHGSAGYSPRPNLYFGPVVHPRFYAYGPVNRPSFASGYALAAPLTTGFAVTTAPPAPVASSPIVVAPPALAVASENGFRFDVAPENLAPPFNGVLPPQTVEPPLATEPTPTQRLLTAAATINLVKPGPAEKATGYVAYGEALESSRPKAVLVKNQK